MATYGDMVTLLMAFFVMLFAISTVEQEKFDAFISGLDHFGNRGTNPIGAESDAPLAMPEPEFPNPAVPAPVDDAGSAAPESELTPELEDLGRRLVAAVAAAGHPGAVEIMHDDRGLGVSIETDRVLFEVGSARVTAQGTAIIAAMAPLLGEVDHDILVEGHADTTPLNRHGYTNWNLSTDRAVAVVNSLIGRHGLSPQRLTASGFGEFRPRDPGTSPEAKARNRRVELIVVGEGAAP